MLEATIPLNVHYPVERLPEQFRSPFEENIQAFVSALDELEALALERRMSARTVLRYPEYLSFEPPQAVFEDDWIFNLS